MISKVLILGEEETPCNCLYQSLKLVFEDVEIINWEKKNNFSFSHQEAPYGILVALTSKEMSEKTHSIFLELSSKMKTDQTIQWLNIPFGPGIHKLPHEINFPPILEEIINNINNPEYKIKYMPLIDRIISHRDFLIDKITAFRHNLQNKNGTCTKLCELKLAKFNEHQDFLKLKDDVQEFLDDVNQPDSFTFTISKGIKNLFNQFESLGPGPALEKHFPEIKTKLDKNSLLSGKS